MQLLSPSRMQRQTFAAALAVCSVAVVPVRALAQTPSAAAEAADSGYSYLLGLARMDHTYREFPRSLPVQSKVRTSSPMLATGALYAVHPGLLFSLSSEVTYFPDTARETWTATGASFNGLTLTDRVLQTNQASFSHSDTRLHGLYRVNDQGFVVGGPSVRTQSFRRHSFEVGADNAVSLPRSTTVEETSTEVMFSLGLGVESGGVKGRSSHYSARALVSVPMIRKVENTNHPGVTFDGTRGYDLSLEGRYSLAVHPGMHVGLWGRWSEVRRSAQSQTSGTTTLELPRHEQSALGYGIELLWKL
jgi:hypothetical protein